MIERVSPEFATLIFVALAEAEEYVAEASEYASPQDIFVALALRSNLGSDN